jgi:SAM-dependent methyltransferase
MHMLYHASDPDRAVREIARVLRPDGMIVASTNGLGNMAILFEIAHRAFADLPVGLGASAFSLESGEPVLGRYFKDVTVRRSRDVMRVTDPADVVAYLTSFPPGDRCDAAGRARLAEEVDRAFATNNGVLPIARDGGYIVGRMPRRKPA